MRGVFSAAVWALYLSSAACSRAVGWYFPALGSGFLGGVKSLISKSVTAFKVHVGQFIFDQLANARRAVDMRHDLEQEIRRQQRRHGRITIGWLVLIAHAAGGDPHRAIVEGPNQRIDYVVQRRLGEFFGKAPELAAAAIGG